MRRETVQQRPRAGQGPPRWWKAAAGVAALELVRAGLRRLFANVWP